MAKSVFYHRKTILLLWIIAVVGIKSFAQTPLQLTLSDAISIALENNYQISISREEAAIAKNNNSPGAAGRYPSVQFSASQVNRFNDSESNFVEGQRDELLTNSIQPAITANWTIFDGFRVNITKRNLEALEELSEGNAALVVENTIQSVILGYYNVLLENEKLLVLEEVKKLSRDRLKYVEARKDFGSATTFDVLQANDAYLSDSVNNLRQELALQNATLLLKLLMAFDENEAFNLTDNFSFDYKIYNLEDLKSKLSSNNRNLMNLYINQKILENSTELSRGQKLPGLFFNTGADYSNSRLKYAGEDATNRYSFGYFANFTLSFNIYDGGATKRAIRNAMIQENIGLISIAELQKSFTNLLITQFDLYNIRKKLMDVAESAQESSGLNLSIAEEKFKAGTINSFNYRDIQLNFASASIRRLEALYDLIETDTELLRLTGGIINMNE
jgi:outer membrane protein